MTPVYLLILAYLLGSIPTSVWIGKMFYGVDVRSHGSRNAGATNTFRVLGKPAGTVVFILDVMKGYYAVWLMTSATQEFETSEAMLYQIGAAVLAVLGHVFPIFAGFRGGKGVATAFGILLALTPIAAIVAFVIFLLFWLAFNFVSLGSIMAAFSYPIIQFALDPEQEDILTLFSIILALTVVISHRQNIIRLLNGDETKTYAFRKKKSKNR